MILFVGPLPPPVHGFSAINARMLERISREGEVKAFDVNPSLGGWFSIPRLFLLLCVFVYSLANLKPTSVYIGFSGGLRQLLDAVFVLLSKMFCVPVYVHHHSYAYANAAPWYSRFVLWVLRESNHIVLCDDMGTRLVSRYGLNPEKVFKVSNAAFVEPQPGLRPLLQVDNCCAGKIRVGFLSNISREKGIFDFFDLVEALVSAGAYVEGVVAGPVDSKISREFFERLSRCEYVRHLGAVYGDEKISFFSSIDVLVFPTRYINEAEPVTILEAQSFGVPVIAVKRGCISCMIPEPNRMVVDSVDSFVKIAAERIIELKDVPGLLSRQRVFAYDFFEELAAKSGCALDELICAMYRRGSRRDEHGEM